MLKKIRFKIIDYKLKKVFNKFWNSLTKEEQLLFCQRIVNHTFDDLYKAFSNI